MLTAQLCSQRDCTSSAAATWRLHTLWQFHPLYFIFYILYTVNGWGFQAIIAVRRRHCNHCQLLHRWRNTRYTTPSPELMNTSTGPFPMRKTKEPSADDRCIVIIQLSISCTSLALHCLHPPGCTEHRTGIAESLHPSQSKAPACLDRVCKMALLQRYVS